MTTYLYGALKQSITEIKNLKRKNKELEEIIINIKDKIKYLTPTLRLNPPFFRKKLIGEMWGRRTL